MRRLFAGFLILLVAAVIASADDPPIRLAILAEDVSSESRALADLLTAELSKAAGVQMVERSEIDRVMAEQKLTAGGLVETASRVQLGRLLKADGLVLIRKDDARQTRVLVRMVETRNGFLAGYYQYPFTNVSLDKIAQDASADIHTSLPKLRVDPAKMQRVAISRIGNATLRADYDWLESDLPVLLAMTFSTEPGVLLMERRQLGEALNEANLAGDKGALKTGNVLIDGEVALIYGEIAKDHSTPIVMTLRFRDATLKEIGRVSREGRLTDLDKMTAETMALALVKLREIGQRPTEATSSTEPEMLLAMAKRHGYIWAADAAYALNPTNTAAKNQLVTQLLSKALASPGLERSPKDILDRAKILARAEQLCREENSLLSNYVPQNEQLEHELMSFLSQPQTMMDADIRTALKPVRETFRRKIESRQVNNQSVKFYYILMYAPAFFNNPLDYFSYTRGVYEIMARSAKTENEQREAAIYAIIHCGWPPELYLDMTESPDPVIRYFALTKLMRFYGNRATRKEHAIQAVGCFDSVLKNIRWLMNIGPYIFGTKPLFHTTVQDLINACPDQESLIYAKLCAKFTELLDRKDYRSVLYLAPSQYLLHLPISNAVPLADRILVDRAAFLNSWKRDDTARKMIAKTAEWRRENEIILTNNSSTKDISNSLIIAARAGDIPHLQQLIAQGNNINIQNDDGLTPLSRAIGGKQSETALWLIRQGADINLASHDGGTPLVWAAWRDLTNVVTELLARNADPNAGFNNGQTALMLAASNGNLDIVKQLIAKGARITSTDNGGQNAFVWSAHAAKPDVLIYYLQNKPDQQSLNKALFRAVISSQTNNIALLLKHGADINTKDGFRTSLLIRAAMYSEPETLQFLIDHGAKVNDPSDKGESALMEAAEENRADNIRVLLRAGADLMYVSSKGRRTVFPRVKAPEANVVLLEALGQYILSTGDDRP